MRTGRNIRILTRWAGVSYCEQSCAEVSASWHYMKRHWDVWPKIRCINFAWRLRIWQFYVYEGWITLKKEAKNGNWFWRGGGGVQRAGCQANKFWLLQLFSLSHLIVFRWLKATGWWIVVSSLQIAESKLLSLVYDNEAKFHPGER
jgi:hypothetical protein